jgi:voltage-gated potassium channel
MLKKISQLRDHFIVCGLGDTGRHAVEELHKSKTPFVVVDHNEDNIKRLRESNDEYREMLYVLGDATDAELLEQLGIDHAKGLISTLATDKENLVITVLARQRNPNLRIVARCIDLKFSERILRAGANSTVSPNRIGGMRIASELLRPHVVGFLDLMLKDHSRTLRIEEIEIKKDSPWIGKTMGAIDLRTRFNLLPMAVKDENISSGESEAGTHHGFRVNPPDNTPLQHGMIVIVMGDVHDCHKARHDAGHHTHLIGATTP